MNRVVRFIIATKALQRLLVSGPVNVTGDEFKIAFTRPGPSISTS